MNYISAGWPQHDERINIMVQIARTPELQKWKMIMEHYSTLARHIILWRFTDNYLRHKDFHEKYPGSWKLLEISAYVKREVYEPGLYWTLPN